MTAQLAFPGPVAEAAFTHLELNVESAAVGVADLSGPTLYVRELSWLDDGDYAAREPLHLSVRSEAWAPSMVSWARGGRTPLWVHTHPGGQPHFSPADDKVDQAISQLLAKTTGVGRHVSILIIGPADRPTVRARLVEDGRLDDLLNVRIAGPVPQLFPSSERSVIVSAFDRQVRAFGQHGRDVLATMTVGIVGLGGTGSPTAEQLLRLGVGEIVAVDEDVITATSVSRGYGSGMLDVGKPKVDVTVRQNERIGLGVTEVVALNCSVDAPEAVQSLTRCDLIFGCTDGHWSRVVLNRIAYYHLVTLIDMGVLVRTREDGGIDGIYGRISFVGPGSACLLCRGDIDPVRAGAERLDPEERRRRAGEGYVPDLDEPEPSVVAYTTHVSSAAVIEALHRLFGIGSTNHDGMTVHIDAQKLRVQRAHARPGCFCLNPAKWGEGASDPSLGIS